jgi:hypothetical protein
MVDWLDLSQTSGSGYQLVSVTALPNYSSARTTTLVVSGHTVSTTVDVEQSMGVPPELNVSPTSCTFTYTGGIQEYTVSANTGWSITSAPDWITFSQDSGIAGETVITATASTNTGDRRSSSIIFSGSSLTSTVNVSQDKNWLNVPLTFVVNSPGIIRCSMDKVKTTPHDTYIEPIPITVSYKINNGSWTTFTTTTAGTNINVSTGDRVVFKGDNERTGFCYNFNKWAGNTFSGSTACFTLEGNIMSIIDSVNYPSCTTSCTSFLFFGLFRGCTGLTSAKNLILPVLVDAPGLDSVSIAFYGMFEGCTSLTIAPELQTRELWAGGRNYGGMFLGCSSLKYLKCLLQYSPDEYRVCQTDTWTGPPSDWVKGVPSTGKFVRASYSLYFDDYYPSSVPSGWTVVKV